MKTLNFNVKKFLTAILAAGSLTASSFAGDDAGLPGEFLNYGVGARPMGMARAFTAVADDVDSIYYNPAGLSTFRSSQLTLQHSPLPVSGEFQYLGYSQPIYALGNFGLAVINVASDDIPKTDSNNTDLGTYKTKESAYLLSYGFGMRKMGFGFTGKMVENKVDSISERGYGADVGGLYQFNDRFQMGAVFHNMLAPSYDYATEKEEFPRILRGGVAGKFFNKHLLTSLELEKTVGETQDLRWHYGMEGYIIKNIVLRAGIDENEIATGLGIRLSNLQFDYSAGFQDVGLVNRFSVKFLFGGYEVDVTASPEVFSPTGLKNKVTFSINSSSRRRVVKWIMTIRNAQDEVIKTYQGFQDPPTRLVWEGKDEHGQLVPAGRYTYRLAITDNNGRQETTPVRSIMVNAASPFEIEAK